MKLIKLKHAFWVVVAIFIISGCASTGTIQPMKPIDVKLTNYKTAIVHVTSQLPESRQEIFQLESLIIAKLREKGIFEKVISGNTSPDAPADLKLDGKIVELKKVNAGMRVMLGAFAGQGRVLVDVALIEQKSGDGIAKFMAEGKSSGGTIFAGTTEQAIERAAEQIVGFIQAGFKP